MSQHELLGLLATWFAFGFAAGVLMARLQPAPRARASAGVLARARAWMPLGLAAAALWMLTRTQSVAADLACCAALNMLGAWWLYRHGALED